MFNAPFVLLDDARGAGDGSPAPGRLYRNPIRIVTAHAPQQVRPALAALRAAQQAGLHAAGYLAYEAGSALMPRAIDTAASSEPLLWFGLFDDYQLLDAATLTALLPDPAGARALPPRGIADREAYDRAFAQVIELIRAGDIYQANLTMRTEVAFLGDPLALYARLRREAAAGYGAVVATGETTLLSLSPELFFALDGDQLTCRPMKGTATRGDTPDADAVKAAALRDDAKQQAENLMIVDLMRNDLARIAVPGSVAVPALFTVETYPTVHQLTSTVTATLSPGRDAVDALEALFPCGSITGAPKQRAAEVIAAVETSARDAYTGAIGRISPGGAVFNVAIRTLAIRGDDQHATLGLGSGVVADSRVDDEWHECVAKGAFVTAGQRRLDLIETMAFDPVEGLPLLERHLARMKASAAALGFAFDRHAARNDLQAATFRLRRPCRLRLLLAASGAVAIEVAPAPPAPVAPFAVAVVPLPVAPRDFRLAHKTSDRGFYDAARRAAGTDEVVFEHDGRLTEGSFTSLFVERDGVLVTPPLRHGLLPGVLRAELLATGRAREGELSRADLAGSFFVGNALRGLIPARLAVAE
ncbi:MULTISPECIES: aminodeoxychorismate synthase component I [unclassified Sphingomonas]|uniref:aminodeoxychorismate synthase component I n=1 Tax=unclassified Sphingomonas TaxID=196159 RepID=UPI00226AD343|nr:MULTISPECIES: aminodeoxychorismate synthase component I [unclassified Sphingomonas]